MCYVSTQPISEHAAVIWVTFRLRNIDRGISEAEHDDIIGEIGNAYRILMAKLRGMCPLGRSKRCDDDIERSEAKKSLYSPGRTLQFPGE